MTGTTRMLIEWRHLDLGETCGRCSDTGANLWVVITQVGQEHLFDNVELEFENTILPSGTDGRIERRARETGYLSSTSSVQMLLSADEAARIPAERRAPAMGLQLAGIFSRHYL